MGRLQKAMSFLGLADEDYDDFEPYEEPIPSGPVRVGRTAEPDPGIGSMRTIGAPRDEGVTPLPSGVVPRPVVRPVAAPKTSNKVHVVVVTEFKDAEDDARYRPYRPVPRGLITLRELAMLGAVAVVAQIALNLAVIPAMLVAWVLVLGYMLLMWREFFVAAWLKRRPILYMLTHMAVMPLIDFYTTGLDWLDAGAAPPRGLEFFLTVTFLNGIVIEVGRKIRAAEQEETGVETYSALYGARRATLGWLGVMTLTWGSAVLAALYAGFGSLGVIPLTGFLLLCAVPALLFLRSGSPRHAKLIETAAGIWTLAMYLTLGAAPMLIEMLGGR